MDFCADYFSDFKGSLRIFPGDVIGSGTVQRVVFELNQTNKTDRWLNHNDVISLSVEKLEL